jgi:hypothetical protein
MIQAVQHLQGFHVNIFPGELVVGTRDDAGLRDRSI